MSRRARIRRLMRRVMSWKFLLDLLTILLVVFMFVTAFSPSFDAQVVVRVSSYWLTVRGIFVGAREAGRWVGDHQSDNYLLQAITNGKIYLAMFVLAPMVFSVPALVGAVYVDENYEAMLDLSYSLAWKVLLIYVVSRVSKTASANNKQRVERFSSLLNTILGNQEDDNVPGS